MIFYRFSGTIINLSLASICLIVLGSCNKLEREPRVETGSVSVITTSTANASGNIIDTGAGIIEHGHCWGQFPNVDVSDTKTSLGAIGSTGVFSSQLKMLQPGTKYYIKAYVKSGNKVFYGKELSFITLPLTYATVTTSPVSGITQTTAVSGGSITSDGGSSISERGVCWSTSPNPTVSLSTKTTDGSGTGSFTSSLTGLSGNTTYHVRAYATTSAGTAYGNDLTFTTSPVIARPTVTTATTAATSSTTATSGGNVTSDGGSAVTARGVCWSTSANPTVALSTKTTNGTGTGSFTSTITGLSGNTTYHVRAYATNSAGTNYGSDITFTTPASVVPPTVSTGTTTATSSTTATSGGNVISDGGSAVTARGVCWSTSGNPTIALSTKTTNGTGTGSFTSTITGLTGNTTYHVRAYATNSAGTNYGSDITFTTPASIAPPAVSTGTTTATSSTTATSGGNVISDGGSAVTARGVCWSTSANPTVALSTKTIDGTGTGSFTSSITGLTGNTTYHVRAYATNSAGTNYGSDITFTTPASIAPPTVSTGTTTATSSTTATSGGHVSSAGGSQVIERGVCWSTRQNPEITDNRTINGSGEGAFTSTLVGLSPNTTYYVRAYATNNIGTAYGNQVSIITDPQTVTDRDGNIYNVIRVGTQLWMKENLRTTKYNDGSDIPLVTDNMVWSNINSPAYCWYDNNPTMYKNTYGSLYNWFAVNTGKLCPTGWHVPSTTEWTILSDFLGGENVAGGRLKETGTAHWNSPNTGATNESGFTAVPGGYRHYDGQFFNLGNNSTWWSATEASSTKYAVYRCVLFDYSNIYRYHDNKELGFSVRCVKD